MVGYRDAMPYENPDGEGHWSGSECPCCPWAFIEGGMIVVVHQHFTEQIIHTQSVGVYDDAVETVVEWEIQ